MLVTAKIHFDRNFTYSDKQYYTTNNVPFKLNKPVLKLDNVPYNDIDGIILLFKRNIIRFEVRFQPKES